MTTILASLKHKIMVGDTQSTNHTERVYTAPKIYKFTLSSGAPFLLGLSGSSDEGEVIVDMIKKIARSQDSCPALMRALREYHVLKDIREVSALFMSATELWECEGRFGGTKVPAGVAAIGSGGGFALAAYMAGAPPKKAVRIGGSIDVYSNTKIQWKTIK